MWIYRDALRSLGNGTESVEGRESERGELERDHCCLSVWFLGGVEWCGAREVRSWASPAPET